jgi:hypothetical protein
LELFGDFILEVFDNFILEVFEFFVLDVIEELALEVNEGFILDFIRIARIRVPWTRYSTSTGGPPQTGN